MQCCPKSIKTTLNRFLSSAILSGSSWTTLHKDLSMQCCLKPLGQHCTWILPVQCSPKSIKTIMNKKFSCVMLSGVSWTTLHKEFTCAMLSQEYQDNSERVFFLCIVVWSLLDNIAQSFYLCNLVRRVNRIFS